MESLRDGRTFATRQVTSIQNGRRALRATVSFHGADHGDEYQLPMPDAPAPETLPREEDPGPGPPFDMRDVGPTERRADGTYRSTRRYWARALAPLPDTPIAHYTVAAFMSDMTGTSFRPYSLGEWGTHADASIDHALWFHREPRFDEWVYVDFHALVNHAGRSTVRGEFYDGEGRLSMSIAQELLIRPLDSARIMTETETAATAASGIVLATLASGQFLMTLDSAVMNVSIATVASDVGTTVTGIQTAITLYTLVMAALMITGGKIGEIIGRKRAFSIGCVIYGCGSFTTALAPNLTVLIIGWSFLEGIGAALIMPAIVALVASNFGRADRPRAYGLVASAGAIAVAAGPLIGGLFTTYASWRWVFACEVIVVAGILALSRRMVDVEPASPRPRLDLVGTVLSATSLALIVLGVLKSGEWGLITAKAGQPDWFGLSPVVWMILGGGVVMWGFLAWERRRIDTGKRAARRSGIARGRADTRGSDLVLLPIPPASGPVLRSPVVPVGHARPLPPIATGVRLLPLSITLLLAAVGIPKLLPNASPRHVVQLGFVAILVGIIVFHRGARRRCRARDRRLANAARRPRDRHAFTWRPGAVTVSAVSDEETGQVGGIQNTVTNLGASIGTALAGAALIAALAARSSPTSARIPTCLPRSRPMPKSSWRPGFRSSPTPNSKRSWRRPASIRQSPMRCSRRTGAPASTRSASHSAFSRCWP